MKHVRFTRKNDGKVFTLEELQEYTGYVQLVAANICNYGKSLDDSNESWHEEIENFYDDMEINDPFIVKYKAGVERIKNEFTAEVFEVKCLRIAMPTIGMDGLPLTVEDFDKYVQTVRKLYFEPSGQYSVECHRDGHAASEQQDDFEQVYLECTWEV